MAHIESNRQTVQERGDSQYQESAILNHRLREDNESFWDAMRQGADALYEGCETTGRAKAR